MSLSQIQQTTTELPTFTDEKLEDYLHIWNRLIERGQKSMLDITLTENYGSFAFPLLRRYTLTYGEERRILTYEQALRVHDWLQQIAGLP